MKCFYYFKGKYRRGQRSAPELKEQEKQLQFSGSERVTKSSCSSASSPRGIPKLYEEKAHNLRVFSFSELKSATNDFSRLLKIGEGGFGSVFKGSIKPLDGNGDPVLVAIKRLNKDALQGHKQWLTEVQFLGVVEHPNLVKLIGYCALDGERGIQRLLVYEYMPNRSLEAHLFNKAYDPLPWKTRLEIAFGAAQGLSYLHEELEVQIHVYKMSHWAEHSGTIENCFSQPESLLLLLLEVEPSATGRSNRCTLFSCGTSRDGDSFLVEWNQSEGALKRTYSGFSNKSYGIVHFDTAKSRFLAAGEDNQIKF